MDNEIVIEDMPVKDPSGHFPEVVEWVETYLTENNVDLSKVQWIKLLSLEGRHPFRGLCKYPSKKAGRKLYQIHASVNIRSDIYPYKTKENVGTRQTGDWYSPFEYVTEDLELKSPTEMMIFIIGHELFHFLRHSRQIVGRNTQCQANRFGVYFLKEWRSRNHA